MEENNELTATQPDAAEPTGCHETPPTAQPADETPADNAPAISDAELQQLIAEAEQRGYLRGRNEQISALMQSPGLLENPQRTPPDGQTAADLTDNFLSSLRPGVWD